MKHVKLFEQFLNENSAKRILVSYLEIGFIRDIVNYIIVMDDKYYINGIYGWTLMKMFTDKLKKAENGPVRMTVDSEFAGAVLDLIDYAEEHAKQKLTYYVEKDLNIANLRSKYAYGEKTRGSGIK